MTEQLRLDAHGGVEFSAIVGRATTGWKAWLPEFACEVYAGTEGAVKERAVVAVGLLCDSFGSDHRGLQEYLVSRGVAL